MPSRTNTRTRRDINRLLDLVEHHKNEHSLSAISDIVRSSAERVNTAWQNYRDGAVTGDRERAERDKAVNEVAAWIRRWRPALFLTMKGAADNTRKIPARGSTPDDTITIADDLLALMAGSKEMNDIRIKAEQDLGDNLEKAKKELTDAVNALPEEKNARDEFSDACKEARAVLRQGTRIVRAIFGRHSPEYKQFIVKEMRKDDADGE